MDRESSNYRGTLSQVKAIAKFTELGYRVSVPIDENSPYDLIIDDGKQLQKIQIKHGRYKNGVVMANTYKMHSRTYAKTKYTTDEIDFFCIYCSEIDKFYLIPVTDSVPFEFYLRIDVPSNKQGRKIIWAKEYEI